MSEMKHTPGPWTAEQDDVPYDGGFETWVVNADSGSICMMDCPKDDMEVNARLIAAAPDLLEACEAHEAFDDHAFNCANCEEWGPGNCKEGDALAAQAQRLTLAAIKKAKGEL